MSNILDKFKDTSIGSSGRVMDFTPKINPSGDFSKIYDINAVLNSWINILSTPKGSYDHDPEFGCNLYLLLFEPADDDTKNAIESEILTSLSTYDNRAKIEKIDISFLRNKKGFSVSVMANYYGSRSNISVTFDEASYQKFL